MIDRKPLRLRIYLTALVMFAELMHLVWEHFHGGVQSHHILNRADLPAISNWLGLLLLPALTWFLTGHIQRRMAFSSAAKETVPKFPVSVAVGFMGSLVFGILLSGAFTHDHEDIASFLARCMLLLALLLPVYRAECVLGFVLGMTFTFGAVLPTVVYAVVAAISAVMHLCIWPVLVRLLARFKRTRSPVA